MQCKRWSIVLKRYIVYWFNDRVKIRSVWIYLMELTQGGLKVPANGNEWIPSKIPTRSNLVNGSIPSKYNEHEQYEYRRDTFWLLTLSDMLFYDYFYWILLAVLGDCGDGTRLPGCGPQQTFTECCDVSIQFSERNTVAAKYIPMYL